MTKYFKILSEDGDIQHAKEITRQEYHNEKEAYSGYTVGYINELRLLMFRNHDIISVDRNALDEILSLGKQQKVET